MRFNDYGKGPWGNKTHKRVGVSRISLKWTCKSEMDKKSIKDKSRRNDHLKRKSWEYF